MCNCHINFSAPGVGPELYIWVTDIGELGARDHSWFYRCYLKRDMHSSRHPSCRCMQSQKHFSVNLFLSRTYFLEESIKPKNVVAVYSHINILQLFSSYRLHQFSQEATQLVSIRNMLPRTANIRQKTRIVFLQKMSCVLFLIGQYIRRRHALD